MRSNIPLNKSTNNILEKIELSTLSKESWEVKDYMNSVTIRFYAELNDFLPSDKKQVAFKHSFSDQTSIKALIKTLGVPLTEIDLILVDGNSVPFSKLIQGGETVAVYPKFKTIDITPVRPEPLSEYHD